MDRKMGPGYFNQPDDDSAPSGSSNSNLDDTATVSDHGNPVPATVFNPMWIKLPDRLFGHSIKPMQIRVPDHGELEPFPTTKNMDIIANRIRKTTIGQILQGGR
jgi:hypothetical protein